MFRVYSKNLKGYIFESDQESHVREFIRARAAALSTFQNIPLEEAKQIIKADLKIEREEGENQLKADMNGAKSIRFIAGCFTTQYHEMRLSGRHNSDMKFIKSWVSAENKIERRKEKCVEY